MLRLIFLALFWCSFSDAEIIHLDLSSPNALGASYMNIVGNNELVEFGFHNYQCFDAVVEGEEIIVEDLTFSESTFTISQDIRSNISILFENTGISVDLIRIDSTEMSFNFYARQYRLKVIDDGAIFIRVAHNTNLISVLECKKSLIF